MTLLTRSRGRQRFFDTPFSPGKLFLGGVQGAWYDPSDMTTLFQDAAGTTPVTEVEQPVGRILDKSGRGNHATQSTAASRPVLRARYNMLTYSEDFGNAAWLKNSATVSTDSTTAPDGTTTGDTLVEAAGAGWHAIYRGFVTQGTFAFSYYIKSASPGRWAYFKVYANTNDWIAYVVNAGTGVVTKSDAGSASGFSATSIATSDAGNGWWRISLTFTRSASATLFYCPALSNSATPAFDTDGNLSYVGDGTSGVYVWGAQLLTAADATATGNAYQRIGASTDYATGGVFRPYLAFDGVDDALATASIDFTTTNKLTAFTGTTKLGNAGALFVELSANMNLNAGAFYISNSESASNIGFKLCGTVSIAAPTASFVPPETKIGTFIGDIAAPLNQIRLNGVVAATSTASVGVGNMGNYPMYIGARAGTSFPYNGRIYSLIVRGAASSAVEVSQTEAWINAKTGAY